MKLLNNRKEKSQIVGVWIYDEEAYYSNLNKKNIKKKKKLIDGRANNI